MFGCWEWLAVDNVVVVLGRSFYLASKYVSRIILSRSCNDFPFSLLKNNAHVFRVPEIVYQPSMLGIEQAGIAETIDFILNHYSAALQTALVQV